MSCGDKQDMCCKDSDNFIHKSEYDKAIEIVKQIEGDEITTNHEYIDENCHGCLVGHILKVTDGLTYDKFEADRPNSYSSPSITSKLMKDHFGEKGWMLDQTLSAIHSDYADDWITVEEMKEEAIKALEAFRDKGDYEYTAMNEDEDYYDDGDDYEEEDDEH